MPSIMHHYFNIFQYVFYVILVLILNFIYCLHESGNYKCVCKVKVKYLFALYGNIVNACFIRYLECLNIYVNYYY